MLYYSFHTCIFKNKMIILIKFIFLKYSKPLILFDILVNPHTISCESLLYNFFAIRTLSLIIVINHIIK